jgi:hypothetical protein
VGIQIVPVEKYVAATAQAMGRTVFKNEFSESKVQNLKSSLIADTFMPIDQPAQLADAIRAFVLN